MSVPILGTFAARARDIPIEVESSCNCCWFKSSPVRPSTFLYINERGEAVIFDPKKADDERQALRRCYSNLQKQVQEIAVENSYNSIKMQKEVEERVGIDFEEEPSTPPTVDLVLRINSAIKDILS